MKKHHRGIVFFSVILILGFTVYLMVNEQWLVLLFSFIFISVLSALSLQLYHFYTLYQKDNLMKKELMMPCHYCEAPIYKTDKQCPYCKKSISL